MTVIESKSIIDQPVEKVYEFLADFNNHERLMPDNVANWSSTKDEASFAIQNMAKLALKVAERKENQEISIVPAEKAPFDLTLIWKTKPVDAAKSEVTLTIQADLNMMMKMVASGPLKKLTDFQTAKLKEELVF
ncbi:SRPBCC family protein [Olivibacter sp. XZL3]|uniref:SRPBCC family protein n=1 Tax=Olivibacter sp. XZL3 TaxID=1735116 RepID=UPI001066BAE7|nr:SRPBCC family protein [Olivibacter sp. XZL3]